MERNIISGWCLADKNGEEQSIEGYLKAWNAIKELDVGPSHINLAAEIANRFMSGRHYANMVHFVNSLDERFLRKLKENEKFVRSLIALRMTQRKYSEVFSLLETGRFSNKEGLLEMWDEAHYREWEERMGKPLNALLRYRIRQRFLPPQHICPNGSRPTTRLPDQALSALKDWLMQHPNDPYPSKTDKDHLMKNTGLSLSQIKTWFANARRRLRLKKEKRNKNPDTDAEISCSEPEVSDSHDELPSTEDLLLVPKEEVREYADMKPCIAGTLTGMYPGDSHFTSTQQKPRVILHPDPKSTQSHNPPYTTTASNQTPLFQASRQTTSKYLMALAGMCEEFNPTTYQVGVPRQSNRTFCTINDPHPSCGLPEAYKFLLPPKQAQSDQYFMYPRQRSCSGDNPYKPATTYQELDPLRPYSISAPPNVRVGTSQSYQHQPGSVMSGFLQDHTADPCWQASQRPYRTPCYFCYSQHCIGCRPATTTSLESGTTTLPSIATFTVLDKNTGVSMLYKDPTTFTSVRQKPVSSEHVTYPRTAAELRTSTEQQCTPLPAFHASFDIMKIPVSVPRVPLSRAMDSEPVVQKPERQEPTYQCLTLLESRPSPDTQVRRRHRSQPVASSVSQPPSIGVGGQAELIPRSFTGCQDGPVDASRFCRKRSVSVSESETRCLSKHLKHAVPTALVVEGAKVFAMAPGASSTGNGHSVETVNAAGIPPTQVTGNHSSPSSSDPGLPTASSDPGLPSHSTHSNANTTQTKEGMNEIAQVLLDLSTKGSKVESDTENK